MSYIEEKKKLEDLKRVQHYLDTGVINIEHLISVSEKKEITYLDIQKILNTSDNKLTSIIEEYREKKENITFQDIESIMRLYHNNDDMHRCITIIFQKLNKCIDQVNKQLQDFKNATTPTKRDFEISLEFLETNIKWQYNYLLKNHDNKNLLNKYNTLIEELDGFKNIEFNDNAIQKVRLCGRKFSDLYFELAKIKNISEECKKNISYVDDINKYSRL